MIASFINIPMFNFSQSTPLQMHAGAISIFCMALNLYGRLSSHIGKWRNEKFQLETTVRGDLMLMKGTTAKKLVHTFPRKG